MSPSRGTVLGRNRSGSNPKSLKIIFRYSPLNVNEDRIVKYHILLVGLEMSYSTEPIQCISIVKVSTVLGEVTFLVRVLTLGNEVPN